MATEASTEVPQVPIWAPNPNLDPTLHEIVAKAVYKAPYKHLFPPQTGETFDFPDAAGERLRDWAMSQGFAVVSKGKEKRW